MLEFDFPDTAFLKKSEIGDSRTFSVFSLDWMKVRHISASGLFDLRVLYNAPPKMIFTKFYFEVDMTSK